MHGYALMHIGTLEKLFLNQFLTTSVKPAACIITYYNRQLMIIIKHTWGHIFSRVWPFYEWAVSDLGPKR